MPQVPVTFIIAEDDDFDYKVNMRAFKDLKISNPVVRALDGKQVLSYLRGDADFEKVNAPFIILMDLNMPGMDGLECIKHIRADETHNSCIIFVLTTSNQPKDVEACYAYNVAGYIRKTDMFEDIEKAIKLIDGYSKIILLPGT